MCKWSSQVPIHILGPMKIVKFVVVERPRVIDVSDDEGCGVKELKVTVLLCALMEVLYLGI